MLQIFTAISSLLGTILVLCVGQVVQSMEYWILPFTGIFSMNIKNI